MSIKCLGPPTENWALGTKLARSAASGAVQVEENSVNIEEFASKHRLRTKQDELGETICAAKRDGSHIYEHSALRMGVVFCPDRRGRRPPTTRQWNRHREAMLAADFTITQDCDGEGCATFNPYDAAQVKVALKVAGVRPKRSLSPEHLTALAKSSEGHRFKTALSAA
jgi:hypothetical protein